MSELTSPIGSRYTDEQRRAACAEYLVKGNAQAVANSLGIPHTTILDWKNKEWWHTLTVQLRGQTEDRITSELDQIIERAHRETLDRLDNGDVQLVKGADGYEERRVPIKGRDAATIAAIAVDKRQILLNKPTSISGRAEGMSDLMAQFERLARESRDRAEKVVSEQ